MSLLVELEALGVRLSSRNGRLTLDAPEGAVTEGIAARVREHRDELLSVVEAWNLPVQIHASEDEGPWPLSPGQRRLWSLLKDSPDDASYNLPLAYRIRGPLDAERLELAFKSTLDRHPVLRAPIHLLDGVPMHCPGDAPARAVELRSLPPERSTPDSLEALLAEEARRPFDFASGPFLRATLWRISPEDHVLLVMMHHIVSDGWSFLVLVDELEAVYTFGPEALNPLRVSYRDVADWQRRSIESPRGEVLREYWMRRFDPAPPAWSRSGFEQGQPDLHLRAEIPADAVAEFEAALVETGGSLLMGLLTCFGTALRDWTGLDDLVICVPAACRERAEVADVIGYVNNVLPVRVPLHGASTFLEALARVRSSVLGAYAHRDLPLQEIAALPVVRRTPLTRAMLSLQDEPMREPKLDDLHLETLPVVKAAPNFDVSLSLERHERGLSATLASRRGIVDHAAGQALLDGFAGSLTRAGRQPDAALTVGAGAGSATLNGGPPARTPSEAWMQMGVDSAVDADALVAQLIMAWEGVLGTGVGPDSNFFELGGHSLLAVALIDAIEQETGHTLSLANLVEYPTVGQLAGHLRERGWAPPDGVTVAMGRSAETSPVFLFHSFEGHVFFYNTLARAVGGPVFGMQAVGIDGRALPQRTVEDMARRYRSEIRGVQPAGPYRLAAMCFGIAPALEVGRLLLAEGEECELIFIDSVFEHLDPSPVTAAQRRLNGPLLARWRARAWLARERVRRWREIRRASPYLQREMRLKDSIVKAWYQYEPHDYPGPLTFVRSQESSEDPSKGWQVPALERLVSGEFRTVVVPGDHFTILREPRVVHLAGIVAGRAPK